MPRVFDLKPLFFSKPLFFLCPSVIVSSTINVVKIHLKLLALDSNSEFWCLS